MSSWRLPDAEYKLRDAEYKLPEAPGSSQRRSQRRPDAPGGAKEAPGRTPKRLLAYSCSEINDFEGDKGSRAAVKSGRADALGR